MATQINLNPNALKPIIAGINAPEIITHGILPVGYSGVKGQLLGWQNVAARNEVDVFTLDGSAQATGAKFVINYTDAVGTTSATSANLVTTIPTPAEAQTMLDTIFGAGNTTVVRTGTGPWAYTVTFGGTLTNRLIAGTFTTTGTTFTAGTAPTFARSVTTTGSAGPSGQLGNYASGNSDGTQNPRALLRYDVNINRFGSWVVNELFTIGGKSNADSQIVTIGGHYRIGDLVGLDATAITNGLGKIVRGFSVSDTNGWLRVG